MWGVNSRGNQKIIVMLLRGNIFLKTLAVLAPRSGHIFLHRVGGGVNNVKVK